MALVPTCSSIYFLSFMKMFFKYLISLLIGLIIGVRLTEIWDYVNLYGSSEQHPVEVSKPTTTQLSSTKTTTTGMTNIDVSLADILFNNTRVLCWIMTKPENHFTRAIHVKQTWGKRCNKLLFMSTENDVTGLLQTIKLSIGEGRPYLWEKTRKAFRYIYDHHFNDVDWFLKADDDTYVIMENLRAFLYQYSTDSPVYFGCKFHPFVQQGYMSGGAGYVLSKEALRRFAEIGYENPSLCSQNNLSEDKEMGTCLQNIGVIAGDSRDEMGSERFMPLAPIYLIPNDMSDWYSKYLFYKRKERSMCCSKQAISFHYIKSKEFYVLDYLLYRLKPFGISKSVGEILPTKANMTELMEKWKNDRSDNVEN